MAAGTSFTSFRNEPINVTFEGRSLQLRPDQLTVDVLSKVFHLIPETILLVSDVGTIATADEGIFAGVNGLYIWTVEGTKATNISGSVLGRSVIGGAFGGPKLKVKPNIAERRKVPYRVPPSSSFRMRNVSFSILNRAHMRGLRWEPSLVHRPHLTSESVGWCQMTSSWGSAEVSSYCCLAI